MAQNLHVDKQWFLDFLDGCKRQVKLNPQNFILGAQVDRVEKFIRPYIFGEKDFGSLKIYKWVDRRDNSLPQTYYYLNDSPIKGKRIRDRVTSNLFCPKDLPSYETPFSKYFMYFGIKHNLEDFAIINKNSINPGQYRLFGLKSNKEEIEEYNLIKKLKMISEL